MAADKKALGKEGSLCSSDPYEDLLSAMRARDPHSFLDLLAKLQDFDADHWYGDPDYCTLLEVACSLPEGRAYVDALLQRGADPNLVNKERKRAPIHVAAESGSVPALRALLGSGTLDLNQVNDLGDTAFHVAAKKLKSTPGLHDDFIEFFLQQPGVDVNVPNRKNYTGLHLAAMKASPDIIQKILDLKQHDMDSFVPPREKKSTRQVLQEKYPEIELPQTTVDKSSDTEVRARLFGYLYRSETNKFIAEISDILHKDMKKVMGWHDGSYTLLQYSSSKGQVDVVRFLLAKNFNPQHTIDSNPKPAVYLACENGYHTVLQEFLYHDATSFTPVRGKTVLHAIVVGKRSLHNSVEQDYDKCLNLILERLDSIDIDIDSTDEKGNTALHYAAKSDFSTIVEALLNRGAYIGVRNAFEEPPLSNIDPKTLENFLDSRMSKNKAYPRDEDFELEFNYEFLVPPSAKKMAKRSPENVQYKKRNGDMGEYSVVYMNTSVNRDNDLHTSTSLRNYEDEKSEMADDPNLSPETDPLFYISHSHDLRYLLKHPVFSSFLYLKWRCIRKFFYINLVFYLLFVTLLSIYVLFIYGADPKNERHHILSQNESIQTHNYTMTNEEESKNKFAEIIWALLVVFEVILISRELFQLAVSPARYLRSPENFLEILLIVVTSVIVFRNEEINVIRKHLSAIAILFSWAELVLLIGRHPMLSTNIEMLKRVSWNFLKFLAWYSILIVAFALSFYTLFNDPSAVDSEDDENFFQDPGMSVLKTVVMLTGEFDASSIPFVSFPFTSQLVFVLFVFLIAIVLFNLLNGLAVSDTQAIKNDAEIVGLVSRVKLIYYFETMLLGNPLSFLQSLLPCCCCCCVPVTRCLDFKNRFFRKIFLNSSLFPHTLSELKIYVLPNQDCRVVFDTSEHRYKQEHVYGSRSYKGFAGVLGLCTIDPEIAKTACNILSNSGKKSEAQALEERLQDLQKQIMHCTAQFSALETSIKHLAKSFKHVSGNKSE
ncbi:transient receptor potential cation channel protein painless-like [Bacillus rossius redtenbacheri]|uniref:transient receptor potential cation channel protein painless-like n=1 Tax=Bacillus rossius redtenbacheri TaxID=93214 RepID=UPI002FDEECDF